MTNLKICVGIATANRRDTLDLTLPYLAGQTRAPDELIICPAAPEHLDVEALSTITWPTSIVYGGVGLPRQRNRILEAMKSDVVVFFDDDYLPAADYLGNVEKLFLDRPELVVATGKVLADGATGPGLRFEDGRQLLETSNNVRSGLSRKTYGAYGCNMAVRVSAIEAVGAQFDETLPLYAWFEDIDFSRQLASEGDILQCDDLVGVHLGTKRSGRSPGLQLGYSQVANLVYLAQKGTVSWRFGLPYIIRNILANSIKTLNPEPWVDRRGRLRGNATALWDLIQGKMTPTRILELKIK